MPVSSQVPVSYAITAERASKTASEATAQKSAAGVMFHGSNEGHYGEAQGPRDSRQSASPI